MHWQRSFNRTVPALGPEAEPEPEPEPELVGVLEVEGGLALLPLLGGGEPWELGGGLEELVGEAGGGDAVLGGGEVLLGVRVVVMGPAVVARVAS